MCLSFDTAPWELNLSESYAYDQGMKLLKEG